MTMTTNQKPIQMLALSNEIDAIKVKTRAGQKVGSVHSFLINKRTGHAAYVVLTIGGFLGMGKASYPCPSACSPVTRQRTSVSRGSSRNVLEGGPSWAANPPLFDQAYANRVASYSGTPLEDLSLTEPTSPQDQAGSTL